MNDVVLDGSVDPTQAQLMQEQLILLDRDDNPIGAASKKTCSAIFGADSNGRL